MEVEVVVVVRFGWKGVRRVEDEREQGTRKEGKGYAIHRYMNEFEFGVRAGW